MHVHSIAFILILVALPSNQAIGQSRRKTDNRQANHQTANPTAIQAPETPTSDATRNTENFDNKKNDPPQSGLITWFTGILAVVAVLQFVTMILQWIVMSRQVAHIASAERAWLMVDVTHTPLYSKGYTQGNSFADIMLKCRNDGGTPCWIENIWAAAVVLYRDAVPPDLDTSRKADVVGPIPLGVKRCLEPITITLDIEGSPDLGQHVVVYGIAAYRHAFDNKLATTTFAYGASSGSSWKRLQGQKKYNTNT